MAVQRFLSAALALFCLTLAYQVCSTSVQGQSKVEQVVASDMEGLGSVMATSTGDVYVGLYPSSGNGARWSKKGNVGSSTVIVSISGVDGDYLHVVTANGDFFVSPDFGQTWTLKGNVLRSGQ